MSMITSVTILVNTCIKIYQEMGEGRCQKQKKDSLEGTLRENLSSQPSCEPPLKYLLGSICTTPIEDGFFKICGIDVGGAILCARIKVAESCTQCVCDEGIGHDYGYFVRL